MNEVWLFGSNRLPPELSPGSSGLVTPYQLRAKALRQSFIMRVDVQRCWRRMGRRYGPGLRQYAVIDAAII